MPIKSHTKETTGTSGSLRKSKDSNTMLRPISARQKDTMLR